MDNKEEGNGIYNSDTDKRITHILAYAEEGILYCCVDVCAEALRQTSLLFVT